MNRVIVCLHFTFVLIALSLFGLSDRFLPDIIHLGKERMIMTQSVNAIFAFMGLITGFGLMARRSGKDESIALAVSTIAAFLLLLASLRPRIIM
jgi:hypothetical protein